MNEELLLEELHDLDAEVQKLQALVQVQIRRATDAEYMKEAYYNMLGPKGREVADNWIAKGTLRFHADWGPSAASMTGEERAQHLLDVENAIKHSVLTENINNHVPRSLKPQRSIRETLAGVMQKV